MKKIFVCIILLMLCWQAYAVWEPTITINAVKGVFDTRDDVWCNIDKYKLPSYLPSKNPWCEYYRLRNTFADPWVGEDFLTGMILTVSWSTALKKIQVKIAWCSIFTSPIMTWSTFYTFKYPKNPSDRLDNCFRDGKNSIIVYAEDANWKVTKTIWSINIDSSTPQLWFIWDFGSGSTSAEDGWFRAPFGNQAWLWRNYSLTWMISQWEQVWSEMHNECNSLNTGTVTCTGKTAIEIWTAPLWVWATSGIFTQYNCNSLWWYPSVSECDTTQVCGSAQGQTYPSIPTIGLCDLWNPTWVTLTWGLYKWFCTVAWVWNIACQANLSIQNGVCGTSDGQNLAIPPATWLCSVWNPTPVSGSWPWTWSCNGIGWWTSASCSANVKINGICNNMVRGWCTAGTVSWTNNTSTCGTTAKWKCDGTNGGTVSSLCIFANADCPVNGVCGWADGSTFATIPTTSLCSVWSASSVTTGTTYTWTCSGTNSWSTANCAAFKWLPCSLSTPVALTWQVVRDAWTYNWKSLQVADNECYLDYSGSMNFCNNLVRWGYSDWYLPSMTGLKTNCTDGSCTYPWEWDATSTNCASQAGELQYLYCMHKTIWLGYNTSRYYSSTIPDSSIPRWLIVAFPQHGVWYGINTTSPYLARCVRKVPPLAWVCNNSVGWGCSVGTVSWTNNTSTCGTIATWKCLGVNGGAASAQCSYTNSACPVKGACNNTTRWWCSTGTVSWTNNTSTCGTTATWLCSGVNGGASSAQCSYTNAACPVTGVCWSAHGTKTATYPITWHCTTGAKTDVDTVASDGAFNWTCAWSGWGSNTNCSATKKLTCPSGWIIYGWACYSKQLWPTTFNAAVSDCASYWWIIETRSFGCGTVHPDDVCLDVDQKTGHSRLLMWQYASVYNTVTNKYDPWFWIRTIDSAMWIGSRDISEYYTNTLYLTTWYTNDLAAWWWGQDGKHYYRCMVK